MTYKIHNGTLFDYTAGVYCGVLVKEKIMRKLAAAQQRHMEEVKKILSNGADNGEVFPSMWTLAHIDGEQHTVIYIDESCDVLQRIKMGTRTDQPRPCEAFIASSMEEAEQMFYARHAELAISES